MLKCRPWESRLTCTNVTLTRIWVTLPHSSSYWVNLQKILWKVSGGKLIFQLKYIFHMRCLFSSRHSNFLWEGWEIWRETLQSLLLLQMGTNWFWFFVQVFEYYFEIFSKRSNVRDLLSFIFKWIFLYVSGSQKHKPDDSGIKKRTYSYPMFLPPSEEITISLCSRRFCNDKCKAVQMLRE